jgi:hypothetical protein
LSDNSITVPPPPYQSPFVNQTGLISSTWSNWIRQLYLRIGGASSPSTAGIVSDITTLQTQVATLQTEVATLNTEMTTVTNLANGLSVGRQL